MNEIPVISVEEARVLGCLIEKQITTPEYYPLTLNALVAACNQKSNRDPVVAYEEALVLYTLELLRERKLVSLVSEAGARVPKYKHTITGVIHLEGGEMAVLCELLLRGPQTVGELRSRASRMFLLADLEQVQEVLENLSTYPDGALVTKLLRQPGTKEARYAHLLCGPIAAGSPIDSVAALEPLSKAIPEDELRISRLEEEVAALRTRLEELAADLEVFKQQFE